MTNNFSYFLAKRYLIPKGLFLVFINVLTITGICLGVGVMIVVLSVMKGFENEFQRTLLGFDPHLLVLNRGSFEENGEEEMSHREIGELLEDVPEVVSQSPFVAGHVLVQVGNQVQTPIMKAIQPGDQQLQELKDQGMLITGELDLVPRVDDDGNAPERVIVSQALADSFRRPDGLPLQLRDMITIYSPVTTERILQDIRSFRDRPEDERGDAEDFLANLEQTMVPMELMVVAIVNAPMYQQFVIPPLYIGQELFGFSEQVHGLAVFVEDPYRVERVKRRLIDGGLLPFQWDAMTWVDQNKPRLDAIRMERSLMSVILFIIVIVGTFCVTVTIIVTTVQKRREIGVMKALGAQTWQIVRVFVHQGQIVGLCGVGLGIIAGMIFLHQLETIRNIIGIFGADPFDEKVYGLAKLPVEIIPSSIVWIAVGSIVACTLAAIPPAWAVARLDAAKALRAD